MSGLTPANPRLILLPLRAPVPAWAHLYQSAQRCWEDVWLGLYNQHGIEHALYADHFLRQDEAACLFHAERCLGMILFRTLNFGIMDYGRDSYFKDWLPEDREKLLARGPKVFVASYLTVDPAFRNHSPLFKFKEVLLDIMARRFLESPADVIAGVTRRDRGIHDESFKLGATLVREDVPYLDARFRVDLVAFYRADIRHSPNLEVRRFGRDLWAKRLRSESSVRAA